MGCMQSSEGKTQIPRDNVSGRNIGHMKTGKYSRSEGLITIFDDIQRSTYTRHPEEDSSEGNKSHKGTTCEYIYSPDSDNERAHSPNLPIYLPRASSPDLSMQRYDDEVPNINNRPCDSDQCISSNADNEFIIKRVTSYKHSSSQTNLTATAPDMSLQIPSRRYDRPSYKKTLKRKPSDNKMQGRIRNEGLIYADLSLRDSQRIYITCGSKEEFRYKKITTEGHLPIPIVNRPNRPRASPPPDHLDQ